MSTAFLEFPPHTRDMGGGSIWSHDQAPGGEKIRKIFLNFFKKNLWISLLEHVNCMKNCFLCLFSPFGQQKLKFFSAMSFFCFSIFSLCLVEFSLYLQEQIWLSHILARKLNIKVCQHNHQAYHGININVCGVWHQYYNISTDSKSYLVLAMASHLAQFTTKSF